MRVTRVSEGVLELELDGGRRRVHVAHDGDKRFVALGGDVFELQRVEKRAPRKGRAQGEADGGSLSAAMPGQIVSVAVRVGEAVTKGQTLIVLEAMKMELHVVAPSAGQVQRVLVTQGQVVERGQQLIELSSA